MKHALKLKARWEHNQIAAGEHTQRGLLIEVTGREIKDQGKHKRPALNLAIVIDRSGSMQGDRLAAARQAALGISRQLRKSDRLSIVAYDTEIMVLLKGAKQNKAGRLAAEAAIAELQPGGCTDLAGGWLAAAKCVAEVMENSDYDTGHVLLLSDGHANHGITDPGELARHAAELAARGVRSSCVGIGHGYSPLQLDAIAEAGHGQLHHSDSPDEIVDITLGELGELTRIAARSTRLLMHFPKQVRANQLTAFPQMDGGHYLELDLGDIPAGRTRKVAFMFKSTNHFEAGEELPFMAKLNWKDENERSQGFGIKFGLQAVDAKLFDPKLKNQAVARSIAELWLSRMGYDAIILNERGLYREAVETFSRNEVQLEELVANLSEEHQKRLRGQKARAEAAVAEEWSGPAKLQALSLAKKFMRSEADYSGQNPNEWSDRTSR